MIIGFGHLELSRNFRLYEFACKGKDCCCHGAVQVNGVLVSVLQEFRELLNLPIRVTSGFRCDAYNDEVGGHPRSFHRLGMAADVTSPLIRDTLEGSAEKLGQILSTMLPGEGNVIWYPDRKFLHCDVGHRVAGDLIRPSS